MLALAVGVLVGLCAMTWLASTSTQIPDSLDRLVFLLAGGLVGVLASTRSTEDPQPVVGVDGGPVEVTDAEGGYGDPLYLLVVVILILVVLKVAGVF